LVAEVKALLGPRFRVEIEVWIRRAVLASFAKSFRRSVVFFSLRVFRSDFINTSSEKNKTPHPLDFGFYFQIFFPFQFYLFFLSDFIFLIHNQFKISHSECSPFFPSIFFAFSIRDYGCPHPGSGGRPRRSEARQQVLRMGPTPVHPGR